MKALSKGKRKMLRELIEEQVDKVWKDKIDNKLKKLLVDKFEKLKDKGPIFNNAYLISGVKGMKKHISILNNMEKLNLKQIIKEIVEKMNS